VEEYVGGAFMSLLSTLGWIGNVFLIWGIWEIGNKRRWAHLLTVVGELAWIGKCMLSEPRVWDLAVICSIFLVLAARCWVKWGLDVIHTK
jgi:hypothetical protein